MRLRLLHTRVVRWPQWKVDIVSLNWNASSLFLKLKDGLICYWKTLLRYFQTISLCLGWLGKSKNWNTRLLRWSLFLQEYDYKIVHVIGRKSITADTLSRSFPFSVPLYLHAFQALPNDILKVSPELLMEEQKLCDYYVPIIKFSEGDKNFLRDKRSRHCKQYYCLENNIFKVILLVRNFHFSDQWKICVCHRHL